MAMLSDLMNAAGQGAAPAEPASRVQMRDLMKQLSEPKLVAEFTPNGTATRQVRTAQDEHILERVESMRDQLADRRSMAKDAFSRGRSL